MTGEILQYLETVERERSARDADPSLKRRVMAVKRYQQLRFERTYADLLASERYRHAARFFLEDLYGPMDFRERDQQFARIVPRIATVFPGEVTSTVLDLARLHATSEELDSMMGLAVDDRPIGRDDYIIASQKVGMPSSRELQLQLVIRIGQALDRYTRHGWMLTALKLMRAPARAAGLWALQSFLEAGMASFRTMGGAATFLDTVMHRERALMVALFAGDRQSLVDLPVS